MKAIRAHVKSKVSPEQVWELANDLAMYEACKPFLEPVSDEKEAQAALQARAGAQDRTFRAVVIKVEADGEPCRMERVGLLAPYGCDEASALDSGFGHRSAMAEPSIVARVLQPITRVLQRVQRRSTR